MSNAQPTPSHPKSDVRNTEGKDKQTPQGSAVDLEEFYEKHYEKLLPIMADKYEHERRKKEKPKEVKARLDFGDVQKRTTKTQESTYSESRTRTRQEEKVTSSKDLEAEDGECPHTPTVVRKTQGIRKNILKAKTVEGDIGSLHHKSKSPVLKMRLSKPGEDPEDHLKIFQAAAKMKRWAMPTWCHMFNSTLTGNARVWFDDLPPESIDKDFIQRYKSESGNVKGAPECMRIFGFVHGITNPELMKRFHYKILKTVDEMMKVATSFLQGQEAALNQERKKTLPTWKHQEGSHKQDFKKEGSFRIQRKQEKRPDIFTLLTKTPKEIFALEKGKFKTPPPMTTPVEKQNANKFCEFHREVGHNTDECNHLRKQIEDMLKPGKLSHLIKELKQNNGKDLQKKRRATRKRKTSGNLNDSVMAKGNKAEDISKFLTRPRSLGDDEGVEGPLIIEAEIGGHQVH
ncbi:hypothetical protein Tco_1043957, partial [Tanacetum coccineum]